MGEQGLLTAHHAFPERTVHVIDPFGAGGGVDIIARPVADRLLAAWGQRVTVENHPGAGSTVAPALVAEAPADVYALLINTSAHAYRTALATATPPIQDGGIIALGVSTMRRSRLLPDVPPLAEAGVGGFDFPIWYGIWARAGLGRTPGLAQPARRRSYEHDPSRVRCLRRKRVSTRKAVAVLRLSATADGVAEKSGHHIH